MSELVPNLTLTTKQLLVGTQRDVWPEPLDYRNVCARVPLVEDWKRQVDDDVPAVQAAEHHKLQNRLGDPG